MDDPSPAAALPEFRIRNLEDREPASDTSDASQQSSEQEPKPHAFKMRKASYDNLVTQQPRAVLSYDDIDDGEKITVGSGTELEQRLQEPAIVAKYNRPPYISKQDVHSFEIDLSQDAYRAWHERRLQEVQRKAPDTDFSRQADRLDREIQDHIGRLSSQMKSASLNDAGCKDPDASDKVSVAATAGESNPGLDYLQRTLPPMMASPCADPQGPFCNNYNGFHLGHIPGFACPRAPVYPGYDRNALHPRNTLHPRGTLTSQGTKLAQEAAAVISPHRYYVDPNFASPSNEHTSRWASYGNFGGSFKQSPAELSSGSQAPRAELDADKSDGQPLLQMFQNEIAKITKPNQAASNATQAAQNLEPTAAATGSATVSTAPAIHQTPIEATGQSLKTLFQGLGDLAAQTLAGNPKLVQSLAEAGKGLQSDLDTAVKTGLAAVQSMKASARPEVVIYPTEGNPVYSITQQKSEMAHRGVMTWTSLASTEDHGFFCITKCELDPLTCPVRLMIQHLAQRMEGQKGKETPNEPTEQSTPKLEHPSSQSHWSTQTTSHETRDKDRSSFEADRILAKRFLSYNSMFGPTKVQYLVRWVGHGAEHDVWYDGENLGGCKGLVDVYERSLKKKGFESHEKANEHKDHLHAIHLRTAGDRMVASRRWEEPEDVRNYREESCRQQHLEDLSKAHFIEAKKAKTVALGPEPVKPMNVEAHSSSLDPKANSSPSTKASQSTLRHRKSWHPASTPAPPVHRAVSPTVAAQEKYPALSSFEAAHHGAKDDRRKSVPDLKARLSGLDFPYVEASRQAWLGSDSSTRGEPQKDKSVRFDLKDPWMEKKRAQDAWEWKQKEEQSLYGLPASSSAKKEGKKPARYSSPPPPKPAFEPSPVPKDAPRPSCPPPLDFAKKGNSSGDIWRELTNNASLRRAKSLNFPERKSSYSPVAPFAASPLRFSSSQDARDKNEGSRSAVARDMPGPSNIKSFGPIRPQREPNPLRRSASARFSAPLNSRSMSNKRDSAPTMAGPSFSRSQSTKTANEKSAPAPFKYAPPLSFDDIFGANPWSQDRSTGPATDPWAFLHDVAKADSSSGKYPAMTPSKPTKDGHSSNIALPARVNVPHPHLAPPAVRARNTAIRLTVENLVNMGYEATQARFVAESADGNIEAALDMLQEDLQARHEGFEGEVKGKQAYVEDEVEDEGRRMPGAF